MDASARAATPTRPLYVAATVAFVGLLRLVFLGRLPDERLVPYIPDDAFYYLVPAHNFATLGRWTFDGAEPSTGFHLLWGYFLAALYKLLPSLSFHGIFAVAGLVQVISIAIAAWLMTRSTVRLYGRGAAWGVLAVFLSASILEQSGLLMESAFVICLAAAIFNWLARTTLREKSSVLIFSLLLGWSVELARSDAGLLCGFLLIMHFVLWRRRVVDASMFRAAVYVLVGALLGVATIFLHTHAISGEWLQASAQQKLFWSSLVGKNSFRSILGTPLSVLQPLHNAVPHYSADVKLARWTGSLGHVLGFVVLLLVVAGAFLASRAASGLPRAILYTLPLLVIGYCLFYQRDGAVLDWYVSNFVVALTVLTAAAAAWFAPRFPAGTRVTVAALSILGFVCSLVATQPWQGSMYRAGIYLRDHPFDRPQGAFNSGIVGFFAGHSVVNLDGLVNDRILPYSKSDRLVSYMARRHIGYIFDSPFMLKDPAMQRRGGYADGKLLGCIRAAFDAFPDDPANNWEGTRIHLYTLDDTCMQRAARNP